MTNWREKSTEVIEKIKNYRSDTDGWKEAKKSKDVTVWYKKSPDWSGSLYKAESIINVDPATAFRYIEPTATGPREKWDKAINRLEVLEQIDDDLSIVRTTTHNAFGGLISARDFTDLVVTVKTNDYTSTNARGVDYEACPPSPDHVRGTNLPCGIVCNNIPGESDKTRVASYIQTDLGGMLPKSLVENALPSNMCDFFSALKKQLIEDGLWKGETQD